MNQEEQEIIDRAIDDLTPNPIDRLSGEVRKEIEQACNSFIHRPLDQDLLDRMQMTVNGVLRSYGLEENLNVTVEPVKGNPSMVNLQFQLKFPPPRVRR